MIPGIGLGALISAMAAALTTRDLRGSPGPVVRPEACLTEMAGLLIVLLRAGWRPGDPTGPGSRLHFAYRQATTVTWLGIVACQIGTAFAVCTEHASLREVGVFTNRPLLGAIGVALAFAAIVIYLPLVHRLFGTEALAPSQLLIVLPFPFIVWGADEARRWVRRRRT
ncbi:MAG TPA: cation-translocating P-type ATPase C-terminal domain-containing protein [Actinocrinis sp.]|nr:cation-translocating P-type ATPase C-terminal domain-containing protein [Actinocrinis sp.]